VVMVVVYTCGHGSGIYVETLFWIVGLIPGWVKSVIAASLRS
jgi:hypothetical protein